jgi:hypothetical protein
MFLQVFQTLVSSVSLSSFACCIWMFQNRSGVAHRIRIVSSWRHGPTAGALAHEPDALGAHSLPVQAPSGRRPVTSKSVMCKPNKTLGGAWPLRHNESIQYQCTSTFITFIYVFVTNSDRRSLQETLEFRWVAKLKGKQQNTKIQLRRVVPHSSFCRTQEYFDKHN